jgi:hypothetical protein
MDALHFVTWCYLVLSLLGLCSLQCFPFAVHGFCDPLVTLALLVLSLFHVPGPNDVIWIYDFLLIGILGFFRYSFLVFVIYYKERSGFHEHQNGNKGEAKSAAQAGKQHQLHHHVASPPPYSFAIHSCVFLSNNFTVPYSRQLINMVWV